MDPAVMKELEAIDPKKLQEPADALDVAGGWAGRAMSFAAASSDDPAERRGIARRLLARPGLRRFPCPPRRSSRAGSRRGDGPAG
jgi:hypothetical protein